MALQLVLQRSACNVLKRVNYSATGNFTTDITKVLLFERNTKDLEKEKLELTEHLEQLSLVNFENDEAIERLQKGIEYVQCLQGVNTDNVKPLTSLLEDCELYLREDTFEPTTGKITRHAVEQFEGYFIAPKRNVVYKIKK